MTESGAGIWGVTVRRQVWGKDLAQAISWRTTYVAIGEKHAEQIIFPRTYQLLYS